MEIKYFIGIDFGHGETSVSRVPGYNSEEPLSQIPLRRSSKDEDKKVISAICKEGSTWRLVFNPGDLASPSLREGFKGPINQLKTDRPDDYQSLKEFGKLIFKAILENDPELVYNPNTGESNFVICIACPSEWRRINPNIPQEYLSFFRNECGIKPAVLCINESDAAFFTKYADNKDKYQTSDSVFVIDLGSSTIDYTTYCNGKCITAGCDGANLGAHIIENKIIAIGLADNRAGLKEAEDIRRNLGVETRIDAALSLYARSAKERYFTNFIPGVPKPFVLRISFSELAPISEDHDRYLDDAFRLKLDAAKFDESIAEYRHQLDESLQTQANNLKNNVLITPKYVILSGGASRMWFVEDLAKKHFPTSKVERDNSPEWVVSNGAAKYMKAHYTALQELLRRVGNLDFESIYKEADIEATQKATVALIPSVLADVKGSTDYSALDMVQKFCEFFYGLNSENQHYADIFMSTASNILTDKVVKEIKDVIYNVFKVSVDLSDVKLESEFIIFNWAVEYWCPGGKGASVVYETIKNAGNQMVVFSFDFERPRNSSERVRLADACKETFSRRNPFGATLNPEHLEEVAKKLKVETLELAERIFYEKELFQTSNHKS